MVQRFLQTDTMRARGFPTHRRSLSRIPNTIAFLQANFGAYGTL